MTSTVVDDPDELTDEWMSEALSRPTSVLSVEPVGTGQIGRVYRVGIRRAKETDGPASVVVKLAGGSREARHAAQRAFANEVGFYRRLAPTLRIRVPRCWFGAMSDDGLSFTLVLEDLAPSNPGVQVHGCTIHQAARSIDNLVGLHAPSWSDQSLFDHDFIRAPSVEAASFVASLYPDALSRFLDRLGEHLAPQDAGTLHDTMEIIERWMVTDAEPFSLVHGDYRLDNLMFGADGAVTALDWQTLTIGPPLRDVAYFLGTSVEPAIRRLHEEQIVRRYHSSLVDEGVREFDWDRCWKAYRLGLVQGPMITVLGAAFSTVEPTLSSNSMFLAMASRSCAAIRDLGTLELV